MYEMPEIEEALKRGLPERATALELFVRDGKMSTARWAELFDTIVGVDINPTYVSAFVTNYQGKAVPIVGDSVEKLNGNVSSAITAHQPFNLVSCDNPQGIYGKGYVEHFDIIRKLHELCAPAGYILLCTNLAPYRPSDAFSPKDDYGMSDDRFVEWMVHRDAFYGMNARQLTQEFMINFYLSVFENTGIKFEYVASSLRKSESKDTKDHIFYILFQRKG